MASSPQHEPTMEEILASIRKIISEDSTEPSQPTPPQAKAPEPDVLELTEEVHEEPTPPPAPPQPAPTTQAAAPPPPADEVIFQSIEESSVSSLAATLPPAGEGGIFSEKTRKALTDAFSSVESRPETTPAPSAAPIAPIDGRTLEVIFDHAVRSAFDPVLHNWLDQNKDAVVERMKPVITQWLDEHFPAMLDEAVRAELARVARTRVRR